MKKMLLSVLALVGLAAMLHATNSTSLGAPGNAGRPMADTTNRGTIYQQFDRGLGDCSNGAAVTSILSTTSSVVNVTATAGLGWSSDTYAGPYKIFVVNTHAQSTLIAWLSMTATTIAGTTPAGKVILAGQGAWLDAQGRDGLTLHLQGLTGTAQANVSVCTY